MARRLSYREIADEIATEITSGERSPRSQLPSYTELAGLYGVAYQTAARAVRILRERGLVYGEPGRGVYVSPRTYWQ